MGKASFGGEQARKMPHPAGKIKTFYFKEISSKRSSLSVRERLVEQFLYGFQSDGTRLLVQLRKNQCNGNHDLFFLFRT